LFAGFELMAAKHSDCSLPPCEGGSGRGVHRETEVSHYDPYPYPHP